MEGGTYGTSIYKIRRRRIVKLIKNVVIEAAENLEYIIGRIDVQIEELHNVIKELLYIESDYDNVKKLKETKSFLMDQRRLLVCLVRTIRSILNYYDRCEEESVLEIYEEKIHYVKKECGIINLKEIHNVMKEINIIGG